MAFQVLGMDCSDGLPVDEELRPNIGSYFDSLRIRDNFRVARDSKESSRGHRKRIHSKQEQPSKARLLNTPTLHLDDCCGS
jgi:hypothetical protein